MWWTAHIHLTSSTYGQGRQSEDNRHFWCVGWLSLHLILGSSHMGERVETDGRKMLVVSFRSRLHQEVFFTVGHLCTYRLFRRMLKWWWPRRLLGTSMTAVQLTLASKCFKWRVVVLQMEGCISWNTCDSLIRLRMRRRLTSNRERKWMEMSGVLTSIWQCAKVAGGHPWWHGSHVAF